MDVERCVGSGMCVLTAGEVFDQRPGDGKVVVLTPEPPADVWDCVREAVDRCPVAAIAVSTDRRPPHRGRENPGRRGEESFTSDEVCGKPTLPATPNI
ncbi:Ferredoxin [Micromonospora echinospora]|uniref:Ferredoxin n=1 Tax=Micromonospora echinospora TaxID=1877 RepID=A0A1C4ZHH3_MICEC|nr:Ferredoxin [Micromonospora echinospora]